MLCAFAEKFFLLAEGIEHLAYAHNAVLTKVEQDALAWGKDAARLVLTAAEGATLAFHFESSSPRR